MDLAAALTELAYAKDWTPSSRVWYTSRLGAFMAWASDHDVTGLESLSAPLIRRYVDERRSTPSKTGRPLDSHTLLGHVRAIRALLNWAVAEGLVDANLPKREQKVLSILPDEQISRLYRAAQPTDTSACDTALLSLLLDTGCRASELTGLTLDDVPLTPDDAWLLVRGKDRKQRQVVLGRRARADLHRYIYPSPPRPYTSQTASSWSTAAERITPVSDEMQRPTSDEDREGWQAYWTAQGMPWRREPEIDEGRQQFLAERREVKPDIAKGVYPFEDVKLQRADVEWLLATHESGGVVGPVGGPSTSMLLLERASQTGC